MADLFVDLGLLERTAGALSMLMEEFSNSSRIVTSYEGAIGDPALAGALASFADDWKVHREDLLASMQAVYKMATKSHQAYIACDDKLARDIENSSVTQAPAGGKR